MTLKRLVWRSEKNLFTSLRMVYGDLLVHPKVGMKDVIEPSDRGFTKAERKYLMLAHFDFVITDSDENFICAFELDGWPHRSEEKVIERDKKKDSICKKVGFPLLRISVSDIKASEQLAARMNEVGLEELTANEIMADSILGLREALKNDTFNEFVLWLGDQTFGVDAYWHFGFSGILTLVEARGFEGAKEAMRAMHVIHRTIKELRETSRYTDEEWRPYGYHASESFYVHGWARANELNISDVEFASTEEFKFLGHALNFITVKTTEGKSIKEKLAFLEQLATTNLRFYESMLKMQQDHRADLANLRVWVNIDEFSDLSLELEEEQTAKMVEIYTSLVGYLKAIKSERHPGPWARWKSGKDVE